MSIDRRDSRGFPAVPAPSAIVTIAAAVMLGVVHPAAAENDPASATRFLVEGAQSRAAAPAAAVRVGRQSPLGEREAPRPAIRSIPVAAAKPAGTPAGQHVVVAVYGDRVGQALADGLQGLEGEGATVLQLAGDEAGLSRPDFPDWLQGIRDRLARPDHPAVAVLAIGSNDRAAMQGDTGALQPDSLAWQALYGSRVDATIAVFRDAHVPLIWVGLPAVRSDEASADYVRLNGIVRDHALRGGAVYVDSYGAFTDEAGRYTPVGPDLDGSAVKLRRADGIGFTHAGERKLASFVENDINRLTRHQGADAALANLTIDKARNFDSALQIDVNAQIRREAALAPSALASSALAPSAPASPTLASAAPDATATPRPAAAPAAVPLASEPAAGPVMPLTAPPVTPGGQLAALSPPDAATPAPAMSAADPAPRPGRADDFAWPKP